MISIRVTLWYGGLIATKITLKKSWKKKVWDLNFVMSTGLIIVVLDMCMNRLSFIIISRKQLTVQWIFTNFFNVTKVTYFDHCNISIGGQTYFVTLQNFQQLTLETRFFFTVVAQPLVISKSKVAKCIKIKFSVFLFIYYY